MYILIRMLILMVFLLFCFVIFYNQFMSAGTTDNLREIVEEYSELLMDYGVMKPSRSVALDDKIVIVQSVALQKVILNTLGELAQLKKIYIVWVFVMRSPSMENCYSSFIP